MKIKKHCYKAMFCATDSVKSSFFIFSILIPVAPYINEIIGQIKLKNANGKNAKHPTPSVADIYAPHVFHGIRGDVIVGKVNARKRGRKFRIARRAKVC